MRDKERGVRAAPELAFRSRRSRPALPNPALLDAIDRYDFPTFVRRCFRTLSPGTPFLPNWHINALSFHLDQVRLGKVRRLIVNQSPRSLKSIVSSVAFPAFVLGHEPTKRLIVVSYSSELAAKHANDFRAILKSEWYRRLFPATRISRMKDTEVEVATTRGGYRLATSIDGTITGRGGDIIIVDDPLKPIDALSDPRRERVNEWFNHTLLSRLDNKQHGAIIVVMQRLHVDDLSGNLSKASDEWHLLSLPAIAEEEQQIQIGKDLYHPRRVGDLLHEEREPLSVLKTLQSRLGSDTFAAQYQQCPIPPGGAMIRRTWIQRYDRPPEIGASSYIVQSWDTASKAGGENDFSVCTTWLIEAQKFYLLHVLRGRFDYPELKARAISHAQHYKPSRILIEDSGVGTALIAEMQRVGLTAIAVKPERDKITRMSIQSGKFESGQVFLPREAPWLPDLEAELFAFPNGRHDDQVDSISQALAHAPPSDVWDDNTLANFDKFMFGLALFR
jgi:predicted phage terminase large subunit-like protein